jgi:hypothetical protein
MMRRSSADLYCTICRAEWVAFLARIDERWAALPVDLTPWSERAAKRA